MPAGSGAGAEVLDDGVGRRDFEYNAELEVLRDIGYMNDELVMPILEKNKGNVQQTVLELLDL